MPTRWYQIGPVLKYIEDLAQGMDSKFIVFFRHRLVRQAIVQKLVTLKLKHICIAGDVPSGLRGDLVHSFQTDPQVRIAVLSIEAASFGLTLTAAHHVVFAELHHTPGVIMQAEDRAHRIGQTLPVNVHYLIARGTVDEILWSMIRRKVYVTSSTLDGECKELNAEDGDEDQSRQLSACAAWVQDQEEDADELEDFVMTQLSSKTMKQDHSQRDLRSFFTPKSSSCTMQLNSSLKKHEEISLNSSSNLSKCLQHLNKNASNSIDEGEVGEVIRNDEADSSDDFQASSFKQTQSAVSIAQKPSKTKKRKAAKKKVNNRTATNGNGSHKNRKQPPSWSCSACTFINDGQLLECSICLAQRVHVKTEDSTRITNDLDIGNLIAKGHNVKVLETTGLSVVDSKISIDSVGGSSKETNGSSNRTDGSDRTEILPDSPALLHLSNVSKERSEDKETCTFAEGEDDSGLPPWSCSVCTFYNMSLMIECSMCLTPRRRSKRRSTSRYTQEVERRSSDNINSSSKRRRKRDTVKRDESPLDNSTCVDDTSASNSITMCGVDSQLAGKGLTPEPMESSYCDAESGHNNTSVDYFAILNDDCNIIKSRPRKRLRLGERNDVTEDVIVTCDSQSVGNINASIWTSSILQSTAKKDAIAEIPSNRNCVVSVRVDKMETSQLKIENSQRGKDDPNELCDLTYLSDHSVNMVDGEAPLTEPSSEIVAVEDSISCLHEQTSNKVMENLEELKAAAEEVFMSEWEDSDGCWWEEESSSGQSSCPSSSDTASSSPVVTQLYTGFTKCSNFYALSELKNKLQSTPEQPKANTTIEPSELPSDKEMSPATVQQESRVAEYAPAVEEEEFEEPEEDIPEPMKLKFCLSLYTERVYLYNKYGKQLGINFCMSDVINGNVEDLPTILHDDYNLRQVKRLLEAWKRMGEGKKRVLRKSALVFDDPLGAYEQALKGLTRESSYVRHPPQETLIKKVIDTAAGIGGSIRMVKKTRITTKKKNNKIEHDKNTNNGQSNPTSTYSTQESSTEDKTCYQAVSADGLPLCLFCSGAVEFADRLKCSDWEKRFCSHDCKKEYQVRVSGTAARRALFEAERGVCQLCSLDAHSLFLNITALQVRDRPTYLAQTPYASLPQMTLKRMVMEPKEGMFWEADHITPVSEGGGECGLDNYRTLCVMCHRKETDKLNKRLKQRKVLQYAAGYADISTSFRPRS